MVKEGKQMEDVDYEFLNVQVIDNLRKQEPGAIFFELKPKS